MWARCKSIRHDRNRDFFRCSSVRRRLSPINYSAKMTCEKKNFHWRSSGLYTRRDRDLTVSRARAVGCELVAILVDADRQRMGGGVVGFLEDCRYCPGGVCDLVHLCPRI